MKRIIAAVLALVMMLALVGCGQTEAEKLVGTWTADVDMSSMTNELLASMGEGAEEYFTFEGFSVTLVMTFNEDGTYSSTIDQASAEAAVDSLMVTLEDGMVKMLEDQLAAAGLAMTVDEMLAASGMTMEDVLAAVDTSSLVTEMTEGAATEGKFEAKDGKLFLSDGLDYEVDEAVYDTYELDGNSLTLLEHVGAESDEEQLVADGMYPVTLTKAE